MPCLTVSYDRCQSCLTACSSSSRHRNKKRQLFSHLQNSLHFGKRFIWTRNSCTCRFGRIHSRATTEGNYCLTLILFVKHQSLFHILCCRIGNRLIINDKLQPFTLKKLFKLFGKPQPSYAFICHYQKTGNTIRF